MAETPDASSGSPRGDADERGTTPAEMPTTSMGAVQEPGQPSGDPVAAALHVRLFGSPEFFRLWLTQVVSATGDWLGFLAIAALATRVGSGSPEAAVGLVMSARIIPGFFLGPAAGVFADRFDRKRLMMVCDIGRAAVLASLPFVDTVVGLVVASLVMEVFTLLWAPAKEASVPHLVPSHHLTSANSLSLAAAYGTIPLAAALFSILAKLSEALEDYGFMDVIRGSQEGLAFYFDAGTFALSAFMIWTLPIPRRRREERMRASKRRIELGSAIRELREGWHFVFVNPVVRAVNLGLATGLIGGGMLVPLGPVFADEVLGAGGSGFGILILALGMGTASGVIALSVFQRRVSKERTFVVTVFVAGGSLFVAASTSTLGSASIGVFVLGLCAGTVYVLGFTLLHEHVTDDLRGRIFSALYTLVRLCVLIAFAVGPFLSEILGRVSAGLFPDGSVGVGALEIDVPGVRLTLWTAGVIIVIAGVIAAASMADAARKDLVGPAPNGRNGNGSGPRAQAPPGETNADEGSASRAIDDGEP